MKIIFAGTPDFAVPSLKTLIQHHHVLAVITQPDKPSGRGQKKKPSPIKKATRQYKIKVLEQPINQLADQLKKLMPDLLVVVAYGQILSPEILALPRGGCINLHASLLPKYRGASPIQAAILSGDRKTGVSIIKMTEKLDAGPIFAQATLKIAANETAGTLHNKLAILGANLLTKMLHQDTPWRLSTQDHSLATYTQKITTAAAQLDLSQPTELLERQIRAYNPWTGAWIKIQSLKSPSQNYRLKIFQATIKKNYIETSRRQKSIRYQSSSNSLTLYHNQPALICSDGHLLILQQIQPAGRRIISGQEFVRGYLSQNTPR